VEVSNPNLIVNSTARQFPAVLLHNIVVSAVATIDLTLPGEFGWFMFRLRDAIPATDGAVLRLQVSTDGGSTFAAGATDYSWGINRSTAGGVIVTETDDADTSLALTSAAVGAGNASTSGIVGEFYLFNANHALLKFQIMGQSGYISSGTPNLQHIITNGRYNSSAPVNAIRILASTGNLTARMQILGFK